MGFRVQALKRSPDARDNRSKKSDRDKQQPFQGMVYNDCILETEKMVIAIQVGEIVTSIRVFITHY